LERVPKTFEMTLTKITEVTFDKLRLFLKGLSFEAPDEELGVLDVVMRHRPSLMFTTVGRCFYTPDAAVSIANGAQLWQGFHQSLRPTRGRLLVNLDVSATAFYQAGSVLDIVSQILNRNSPEDVKTPLASKDFTKIERALKGLKIVVNHRGQIRRKYKIAKLSSGDAKSTKFTLNDSDKAVSVAEYFKDKYSLDLQYPNFPVIVIGDDDRQVFLPFEICDIVPGQRHLKKLNEKQTSEMIKFTCQAPHVRSNKISTGMTLLHQRDDEYLRQFGIQVSNEMMTIPARVLPAPTLSYHPASKEPTIQPKEGSWNLRDKMLAQGATLDSWSIVVFGNETDIPLEVVKKFVTMLCTTCEECGVFVKAKQPPISYANPYGNIEKAVIDSYMVAGNSYKTRPQLLMCILPNTGVPLYAEIKRVADTVVGVATQCIQNKHMYASKRQYCANVCLKMNVKLGGMNSFLTSNQLPFVSQKPTIVIGADVTVIFN
jgi:eukaryotic translation initiation factor 2C